MSNKKGRVVIATVKYKMQNSDSRKLRKWKPGSITHRYLYICPNYKEMDVRWAIDEKASAIAKKFESQNEGLLVTYSVKIEATVINDVEMMDEKGHVI